ncbi:cyclase family protein [Aliikangiella coralliicola]|uniref:Cyclase family protein n=1 Tax=Aliikangiella coralliicola TaxID=2592383 RepID=A0A545U851_9GAMM|nr:cyclase family protein [Aliikangiella coralliicola]TQV85583.1 cyclase family protein [Aliikangiella coralliicola]
MKIQLSINQRNYQADLSQPKSIAITLLPNGEQPSHFGAPGCTSKVLEGDGFIGDTSRGGSCNVNQLTIIPHCNGTHTESVAHIVNQPVPVYRALENSIFPAILVSIEPQTAKTVSDNYIPNFDENNLVITREQLAAKLDNYHTEQLTGLAIRTLPNSADKETAVYNIDRYPVYLTNDAMQYIVERKVQHLMVDFPSVDKMYDDGKLSNHRIFWNVALDDKNLSSESLLSKTITEMIFVNDEVADGCYLCSLQIPQIETDAVPSRPVLFKLVKNN